jgi:putative salt-induced outer membrane protein YdiY
MRHAVSIAVLCVSLCPAGFADEVFLKNGDHLTGTIVRLTDSKLVLKSKLVGEVTINLADVRTFSSEAPLEIHLKDGTVLHQPVAAGEPNQFTITAGEPLRLQPFALAQVASINPPPKPEPKWTGSVSGAVSLTSGNTKTESVTGSVTAARRGEKDRITAGADTAVSRREDPDTGDKDTTENWWRAKAQYDYFFTKKFFGFGNVRYEKDAIAELERRIVIGGGAGYQWIETERTSFSTGFGLASLYEKFDNASESNSELSLQAGYNLNKTIGKNLKFLHELTYYPSLDSFSDYFLTTSAELRATMVKNLFASFKVIFDYDATPAPDRGSTDVKYLLGVGLTF